MISEKQSQLRGSNALPERNLYSERILVMPSVTISSFTSTAA